MNLAELKKQVYDCNLELVRRGLVIYTWGNVSAIDRGNGLVVIKPKGIEYDLLTADDMAVTDLDGNLVEGGRRGYPRDGNDSCRPFLRADSVCPAAVQGRSGA